MTEFNNGFIEANRADMASMIDLAEELPLFHKPSIMIKGNLYSGYTDVTVAGQSMQEHDPGSAEGIRARNDLATGMTYLYKLGNRATMQLVSSELDTVLPAGPNRYTTEQEKLANSILRNAQEQIQSADFSYSVYNFINDESGENIMVTSSSLSGTTGAVHARSLALSVSDAYIKKEVTISEMPVSFNGETNLGVKQTIRPADDDFLREAAEQIYDNDLLDDMDIILSFFHSELTGGGKADNEVAELLARYEVIGKADQLKNILEETKQKAEAAKVNSAFSLANPEITLPSAAELDEYKTLLSQIRS